MNSAQPVILTCFYATMAALNGYLVVQILRRAVPPNPAPPDRPLDLSSSADWGTAQRWIVPNRLTAAGLYLAAIAIVLGSLLTGTARDGSALLALAPVVADLILYASSYLVVRARLNSHRRR
ncbi:hypothetical protein ACWIGI_09035 [Nocardia sp. NPDC055321]